MIRKVVRCFTDYLRKRIAELYVSMKKEFFSAEIEISPVFFGWCCYFGERLKVVEPNSVVSEMTDLLKK